MKYNCEIINAIGGYVCRVWPEMTNQEEMRVMGLNMVETFEKAAQAMNEGKTTSELINQEIPQSFTGTYVFTTPKELKEFLSQLYC